MNKDITEEIHVLNVQKGDVLVVKYKSSQELNIPRDLWHKEIGKTLESIKEYIDECWKGQVGMIAVPSAIDFEVIRLEEWFV